jgi:membrane fusion protein (multidrug efflux system)
MTFARSCASIVVVHVVVVLTAAACRRPAAEEIDSETVVSVTTAPAVTGDIRGIVHATGLVTPAPGAELVVVAPEPARIVEIPRAAGDRVRRGEVLVRFEIPSAMAEAQKQQAEVTRARATLDTAKAAETRARELFDRGVAARRELEDSARVVADAEAALAEARASLAAAEAVERRSTVRATFDGVVSRRQHNPGDVVEATASDAVLRVVDPDRLEVIASVPLADAARIAMGAPARLAGAPIDARNVNLKVLARPAEVEPGTASVSVRVGMLSPGSLPVGAPVRVDIDAEQHRGVVLIPAVALVREGEDTAVFVALGEKAQRRSVQIGLTDASHVEILNGIRSGELVIVDGQAGLPNNAAITTGNDRGASGQVRTDKEAPKDDSK